jgi:hypothetical protein
MDGKTGDFAIFEAMFMSLSFLLAAGKQTVF